MAKKRKRPKKSSPPHRWVKSGSFTHLYWIPHRSPKESLAAALGEGQRILIGHIWHGGEWGWAASSSLGYQWFCNTEQEAKSILRLELKRRTRC